MIKRYLSLPVLIQDAQQLATPKLAFKYEVCQLSNEINLLKRLRNMRRIQWQRNRQPTLKIIVNDLNHKIQKLANELRNKHWNNSLEKLDPARI